ASWADALAQQGCGFFDGAQNAVMRTAAANIVVERAGDFRRRRRWIAVEQRLGRNENAAETISALARLLVEKGLLQRMWLVRRAKTFDRRHTAACNADGRTAAGLHPLSLDQHDAGTPFFQAPAQTRPAQPPSNY